MLEEEPNLFSPHKSPKQSTVSCLSCLLLETIQRNTTTGISSRQVFVNRWVFVNCVSESQHTLQMSNSSKLNTVFLLLWESRCIKSHLFVTRHNENTYDTLEVCSTCSSKVSIVVILWSLQSLNILFIRKSFLICGLNIHWYYLNPLLLSQTTRVGQDNFFCF